MKANGKYGEVFAAILVLGAAFYFLYSKGIIFANFESVGAKTAYEMIRKKPDIVVLDVRTEEEYTNDGHLENARLLPLQRIEKEPDLLDSFKGKTLLVYCRSGHRSVAAARILNKLGIKAINLEGGINAWKREGLPVIR